MRVTETLRVAGCVALLGMPAAACSDGLEAVMTQLGARRTGHALFTEQHYVALLDRPVQTSGELYYEAPDKLEKRTLQPRPETMRIAAGVVHIESGKTRRSLPVQRYPELAAFIESLRATLAGDLPALQKYFAIVFEGDAARWQLLLTPRDPRLARTIGAVRIDGSQDQLRQIEVRQTDGDRSVMDIQPLP